MKSIDAYRLLITPLSPIHIGTGESFEPTNYVIEDGILHEFDTGAVVSQFSATDRADLLKIANGRPNTAMLTSLQRFFYQRRNGLMAAAIHRVPVLPGIATLYDERIGRPANIEADGTSVVNRLEIDRTGFNPISRHPVLFGSSIKGAVRTALLDLVNEGHSAHERKGLHEFQGRLFKYRDSVNGRLAFEKDPMRLVQFSDAAWQGEPGLPATSVQLGVNRKKIAVMDKHGNLRKAMGENLYQILECISGWSYRSFGAHLNIQSVTNIPGKIKDRLPSSQLHFKAPDIARACNDFYRPILDAELAVLHDRGYVDEAWERHIHQLLDSALEQFKQQRAFLLRVGRHSGAESMTVRGVRKIKILKGRDQKPDEADEARTVWLAADRSNQQRGLIPFGWALVELHPIQESVVEWDDLKSLCAPYLADLRTVNAKITAKQADLEQARQESERKRLEEDMQAAERAEVDEQNRNAAAERAAAVAAMTPNRRRVEEFVAHAARRVEQLRDRKEGVGEEFFTRVRALAKDALEGEVWTAEERLAAANAIEEWTPRLVKVDMKEQRKKLKLALLKGQS